MQNRQESAIYDNRESLSRSATRSSLHLPIREEKCIKSTSLILLFTKTEFQNQAIMKHCTLKKTIGCNCNLLFLKCVSTSCSSREQKLSQALLFLCLHEHFAQLNELSA